MIKESKMTTSAAMYVYATEMVSSYYSRLHLENRRVLTVTGSGDQVLNAYFFGAKEVVSFDINTRSFFITRLKFSAIKLLSRGEFLKFFGSRIGNASFDYELYKRLRNDIDVRTRKFFDALYKKYNLQGYLLAKSRYFRQRSDFSNMSPGVINVYLRSNKSYLKLRGIIRLKNFVFMQCDIKNVCDRKSIKGVKFDIINLSNVPNYFVGTLKARDPLSVLIKILIKMRRILAPKGKIFYYSYSPEIYPNRIAKGVPLASRESSIDRIRASKLFFIKEQKFKGLAKNTLDRIVVLGENLS